MSEIVDLVKVWTDGACIPNPGNGAWAALLDYKGHRKLISGQMKGQQTNNRAELMAMLGALEALKHPCMVEIVSDSQYAVNIVSGEWSPKGNFDLIDRINEKCTEHEITIYWMREFSTQEQTIVHNRAEAEALKMERRK